MPTAELTVRLFNPVAKPGETLSGVVEWNWPYEAAKAVATAAPETPTVPERGLELRLCWFTSGKGDRDAGVAERQRIETPQPRGHANFKFVAPAGPLSFSGTLVSLEWVVEAVLMPAGKECGRAEWVLSTRSAPIRLGQLGSDASGAV